MATAAREVLAAEMVPARRGEPTPVIIDGGDEVRIALVAFPSAPAVGARFTYGGSTFEIVRAKDHARGFVARPLAEPAS